jgi:molybdopterin molybdotransferase
VAGSSDQLIGVAQARELVLAQVRPVGTEIVAIMDGLGRTLADEVTASGDVPPFACSAMDGYAVLAGPAGRRLELIGESRAGAPAAPSVAEGQAIRISTGAAVPAGATAVIPQEQTAPDNGLIETRAEVAAGQHIRNPGEDMTAGAPVLARGARLGAIELGAATAAGAGALTVARRPRVAVLSTGDELRAPGEPLGPGEIHNSNAPMLAALAVETGAGPLTPTRLADERAATAAGIGRALQAADVVLISGGVSVGPHDHVKPVLAELGVQEIFWRVALQPGKPAWFGVAEGGTLVFGLPGNPVSAVVTFTLFAAPALAALQGRMPRPAPAETAELGHEVRRNPSREQALRVRLERRAGRLLAQVNRAQGSHVLTSLLGADALAMVPAGEGVMPAGAKVELHALAG